MKKLIVLDDDFFLSLKESFLPDSLRYNDMAFLRFVLQFAKDKADETRKKVDEARKKDLDQLATKKKKFPPHKGTDLKKNKL